MTEFALAGVFDAIAAQVPQRECMVQGARRLTFGEVHERVERLASFLVARGLGQVRDRGALANWESGQDHVALYLHNCPEYLEAMLACFRARVVPCNVNYRYTVPELTALLRGARVKALIYGAEFADNVHALRAQLPDLQLLVQVSHAARERRTAGAIEYEAAIATGEPAGPPRSCSPDDLYILFTGGTTGSPKGVLWRQADAYMAALGGRDQAGVEFTSLDELRAIAAHGGDRVLPLAPLMHGAASWVALRSLYRGDTVVLANPPRLDASEALSLAERERINGMQIVGDAFGRPLADALQTGSYQLPELRVIISGGAPLCTDTKRAILERLPACCIADAIGSSESGHQALHISAGAHVHTGRFQPIPTTQVLSADRSRVLAPGDPELGWLAQTGRVPLGYLDDPDKTRNTFPVLQGVRWAVPGDRAYVRADGQIDVVGRDSTTINSGGEKIFAEEVEEVLKQHAAVYDALVCGRPSPRWGQEVCAVVQLRAAATVSPSELLAHASRELARYKLPRVIVFSDQIERSPSGKPDYAWARTRVLEVDDDAS